MPATDLAAARWEDTAHPVRDWQMPEDPLKRGNIPDTHQVFAPTSEHYVDNARFRSKFSTVSGKDGKPYRLFDTGHNTVTVHERLSSGTYRRVGYLTWFSGRPRYDHATIDGGIIFKAYVSGTRRRRGLASALLTFARGRYPDANIRHSAALSADGKAWAAATV